MQVTDPPEGAPYPRIRTRRRYIRT